METSQDIISTRDVVKFKSASRQFYEVSHCKLASHIRVRLDVDFVIREDELQVQTDLKQPYSVHEIRLPYFYRNMQVEVRWLRAV